MTAPETLLELAERCEKATGPDGGLNLDIAGALGLLRENAMGQTVFTGTRRSGSFSVPRYTASLDAAMTLYLHVPERIPADPRKAAAEGLRQRAMDAALKARAQAKDSK